MADGWSSGKAIKDIAQDFSAEMSIAMTRAAAKPKAKATAETRLRARTATAVATPASHRNSWPQEQWRARSAVRALLIDVDLTNEEVTSACSENEDVRQHMTAIDNGVRAREVSQSADPSRLNTERQQYTK